MAAPLTPILHPCPQCEGEGRTYTTITRFIAGSPYPAERYYPCERCQGAGEIEAPACPGCKGPMDSDGDDDPDPHCPGCKMFASELEEEAA